MNEPTGSGSSAPAPVASQGPPGQGQDSAIRRGRRPPDGRMRSHCADNRGAQTTRSVSARSRTRNARRVVTWPAPRPGQTPTGPAPEGTGPSVSDRIRAGVSRRSAVSGWLSGTARGRGPRCRRPAEAVALPGAPWRRPRSADRTGRPRRAWRRCLFRLLLQRLHVGAVLASSPGHRIARRRRCWPVGARRGGAAWLVVPCSGARRARVAARAQRSVVL